MVELLLDHLGVNAPNKEGKGTKRPERQVTSITEWVPVQCFCIYMAVIISKSPERIQDLLGYLSIIVEACREYESDTWLGYDRRFRQRTAASPDSKWAKIDPTLWNMAFTGHAKAERCKHSFSLSHKAIDCESAPCQVPPLQPYQKPTCPQGGHHAPVATQFASLGTFLSSRHATSTTVPTSTSACSAQKIPKLQKKATNSSIAQSV